VKTLVIQSYRSHDVPEWIARCLKSVRAWADANSYDYRLSGDESFSLCGADYLAAAGQNVRSITNLLRLLLVRQAHESGYDRAIWIDADILVFAPDALKIDLTERYAFAREAWINPLGGQAWKAQAGVNNSVFACMSGEPDLDWFILTLRHIAAHRKIKTNYQLGGDLIKGLRSSLGFESLEGFGMFSPAVVDALSRKRDPVLRAQARFHGAPVYAANLCAGPQYHPIAAAGVLAAVDALERTRGEIVNGWLSEGPLKAQAYPGFTRFTMKSRSDFG